MSSLVFRTDEFRRFLEELRSSPDESCAVLILSEGTLPNGEVRFLVNEIIFPTEDDYNNRGKLHAELTPAFVAYVAKKARLSGKSLGFAHTHPGRTQDLWFSSVDDKGETLLCEFLRRRDPERRHLAIVVDEGTYRARVMGTNEEVRVFAVGSSLEMGGTGAPNSPRELTFDRQIRAFGSEGQSSICQLRIGIVGLGGTGSVVAQQLAYLGVRNFQLIDPDVVDGTNLNRLVGAYRSDVGAYKVDVADRHIQLINPGSNCETIKGDIVRLSNARRLLECDIVFSCTDSHASRALLNQIAYQYYLPCIDMGVVIATHDGAVTHLTGRVQMLSPGIGCIVCSNLLDPNTIRQELMSPEQRHADPYILGAREPQPAVISLNSTVASLAVTMFLSVATAVPSSARYMIYNGINGTVRPLTQPQKPLCIICSKNGALGRGDEWPLPARRD